MAILFNLLFDPVVRAVLKDDRETSLALPEIFVALCADAVESFMALRPHQRHAWHALLCQLGALACIRADLAQPPADADGWRAALKGLTPDFPDDEPWRLVSPPGKPAFLQAPISNGTLAGLNTIWETPDRLDMLIIARNHDVKVRRMFRNQIDDWLFALVTRQTMDGGSAAGQTDRYFPISRMNSESGNRPGFSIAPPGGVGAHVRRDLQRLIDLREKMPDVFDEDGLALVWLKPWDGATSLKSDQLDPYYIEICRRVRLVAEQGRIHARAAGSKAARIAFGKEAKGLTGDPWTPIETSDGEAKALTIDSRGFSYRRMSDILFGRGFAPAPLQVVFSGDDTGGAATLVARALARGQGKTEGLHERRILATRKIVKLLADGQTGESEIPAKRRVNQADLVGKALWVGLMMLFQNGPDELKLGDRNSKNHAKPFLDRFEAEIDRDFFEALFAEVEAEGEAAKRETCAAWLTELRRRAFDLLKAAETGSPVSSIRRHRAWVRAESAFQNSFFKSFRDPYFPKDERHDAA